MKHTCKSLLTEILSNYTPAIYLYSTNQKDLSNVSLQLQELWFSNVSPSLLTIQRSDIDRRDADLLGICANLLYLQYKLKTEFSKL